MRIKNFSEWITLKEKLHNKAPKTPYIFEGQVWWASLGENIGTEINGKSGDFTRPVIILKKLSHQSYLVVPVTTQVKIGNWYVVFFIRSKEMFACLNQIRVLDYRRFHSRLGELSEKDLLKVKEGFMKLYS